MIAFNSQLKDPQLRNEFSIFALLSQTVRNEAELVAKINAAISQPQLNPLRLELLAAASKLMTALPKEKPKVFPLPNSADSPIDAVLLRWHLAVIP